MVLLALFNNCLYPSFFARLTLLMGRWSSPQLVDRPAWWTCSLCHHKDPVLRRTILAQNMSSPVLITWTNSGLQTAQQIYEQEQILTSERWGLCQSLSLLQQNAQATNSKRKPFFSTQIWRLKFCCATGCGAGSWWVAVWWRKNHMVSWAAEREGVEKCQPLQHPFH